MDVTPQVLKADSTFLLLGKLPLPQAGCETCCKDAVGLGVSGDGRADSCPSGKREAVPPASGDSGETLGLARFCQSPAALCPGSGRFTLLLLNQRLPPRAEDLQLGMPGCGDDGNAHHCSLMGTKHCPNTCSPCSGLTPLPQAAATVAM